MITLVFILTARGKPLKGFKQESKLTHQTLILKSYVWPQSEAGGPERVQNRLKMLSRRLLQSFCLLTLSLGSRDKDKWRDSRNTCEI